MLKKFLDWFQQSSRELLRRSSHQKHSDKTTPKPPELTELPPLLKTHLLQLSQSLLPPLSYRKGIQEQLRDILEDWQQDSEMTSNSLVVLGQSLEAIGSIVTSSLRNWEGLEDLTVHYLPDNLRLQSANTLKDKLEEFFQERPDPQKQVIVIPNLAQYFLRCTEGLDGIDYLRDAVIENRDRFWVVGCPKVTWRYLNAVSKLETYFADTLVLEGLDGEQLHTWLMPMIESLEKQGHLINFPKFLQFTPSQKVEDAIANHTSPDSEKNKEANFDQYFKQLANKSRGISEVALDVFLRSLSCQNHDDDNGDENPEENHEKTEENSQHIFLRSPELPDLPSLNPDEHYLIFSLILHSKISLANLAVSLGDEESTVRNLAQQLYRTGLIDKKQEKLAVSPGYYPRIREELDVNNFLIESND